ncbi:Deoxyguanosinetriphosphate triphosphohydrolase-like protein [bioreactor metagenome]|uniref:Deoxyguanosinetriphosphate triphosphohydrolase-like protein n=1 Tax=bioreactor metagenome TaxID=1076179 RepID=A0A644YQ71_9ZZZZ
MKQFSEAAIQPGHIKFEASIQREKSMYRKSEDFRSDFSRDYNRILHSNAFRRLKHKTQVFYATKNDHICTRIEHVHHVEAVSRTICDQLGLNSELATAIALGHDLGHAPFGHEGEYIISGLSKEYLGVPFWHERNSLRVVDSIETLPDLEGSEQLLNLTYAVRDGIISHCGEVDQNGLKPRSEAIDLKTIRYPNEYAPYTWEGCVVKIADKIAYLGRDIEDAKRLDILSPKQISELNDIIRKKYPSVAESIFTTSLMHNFIIDLCENSNTSDGLMLDSATFNLMRNIKDFNYENIYYHPRIKRYNRYVELILTTLFDFILDFYDGENTLVKIEKAANHNPELSSSFGEWIRKYAQEENGNKPFAVFDLNSKESYIDSVLTYLSLTTDQYAMRLFEEVIHF